MSARPGVGGLAVCASLRLDVAHDVVAEDAGEPAAEARQSGQRRRVEALAVRLDERERIALERLDARRRRRSPRSRVPRARMRTCAGRPMNE